MAKSPFIQAHTKTHFGILYPIYNWDLQLQGKKVPSTHSIIKLHRGVIKMDSCELYSFLWAFSVPFHLQNTISGVLWVLWVFFSNHHFSNMGEKEENANTATLSLTILASISIELIKRTVWHIETSQQHSNWGENNIFNPPWKDQIQSVASSACYSSVSLLRCMWMLRTLHVLTFWLGKPCLSVEIRGAEISIPT